VAEAPQKKKTLQKKDKKDHHSTEQQHHAGFGKRYVRFASGKEAKDGSRGKTSWIVPWRLQNLCAIPGTFWSEIELTQEEIGS
jgi:Ni/Co efflux regulator RcnB